jgi:hypothetical protein
MLEYFLAATFVCGIVPILGRLRSYYLDENERIAKSLRFDLQRQAGLIIPGCAKATPVTFDRLG